MHFILTFSCLDKPGIINSITNVLAGAGANIEESQQFSSNSVAGGNAASRFFIRLGFTVKRTQKQIRESIAPVAQELSLTWQIADTAKKQRAIIMVSKEGHCLNDLLFRWHTGRLAVDFTAIVSNHEALEPLAKFYGLPFHYIPITPRTRPEAEDRLRGLIRRYRVDFTILARYMQILSNDLCQELRGRAINIHHSFLPSFKGAKPYNQAFERGVKLIGATSHYITADLDEGPIIEQEVIRVDHTHTPEKLVDLGRDVEARTLSEAVRLHAEHRVILDGNRTIVFK